jgi:tetratricopeptide (TPR) repeat protein
MIELMLEAERALAIGLLDQAERHYSAVVAADPRNAIAIVGLARVALERGDQAAVYRYARRALALDPDNPAASHLAHRMAEQFTLRGEPLPDERPIPIASPEAAAPASPTAEPSSAPASLPAGPSPTPDPASTGPARPRPGLLDRLRRRRR